MGSGRPRLARVIGLLSEDPEPSLYKIAQGLLIVMLPDRLLLSCASRGKKFAYLGLKLIIVEWVIKIVRHRSRRIMDKQL